MRKEQRFFTRSFVSLAAEANYGDEVKLINLSEYGGAIWSESHIGIDANSINVITVTPEEELSIGKIQLEVKFRWIKLNHKRMEAGFSIIACFNEAGFRDYLEYLAKKQLRVFTMGGDGVPVNYALVFPRNRAAQ